MLNYRVRRVEGIKGYEGAYAEPMQAAVERGGLEGSISTTGQDADSHRYGLP
jgi:hypothetical protein